MMCPRAAQPSLFPTGRFPGTRYQGSKRKLASAILENLQHLEFQTVLDAFGGTAAMSFAFKSSGKSVVYNDILAFNHQIGTALIENDRVRLDAAVVDNLGKRRPGTTYGNFIESQYHGIYYTAIENRWLDIAAGNVGQLGCRFKRALAWFVLFQAALAKRPYNLFHRSNLYMRTADVDRSFGNKATWDRPFSDHVAAFAAEANEAIIDSGGKCRAICEDVMHVAPGFDLVYVDPPYVNQRGAGVDYRAFYHFLEGMVQYSRWPDMIDLRPKHRPLRPHQNPWTSGRTCEPMFGQLFERFAESILVVSYRSDGIPGVEQLASMLARVKRRVRVITIRNYQYALSTNSRSREVLLIGSDS